MAVAREIEEAVAIYDPRSQISPIQMRLITGVIAQHHFAARLLVHGCGFDSRFWHTLNAHGRTLFVEDDDAWVNQARQLEPGLEVARYPHLPTTVAQCAERVDADVLAQAATPDWAQDIWDIVLIDGPKGYEPHHPGRALPIFWAAQTLQDAADIFVDDYDRPLERRHCDALLRCDGRASAVLPGRDGKQMYWRMGVLPAALREPP